MPCLPPLYMTCITGPWAGERRALRLATAVRACARVVRTPRHGAGDRFLVPLAVVLESSCP